jgi:hypothetical protein
MYERQNDVVELVRRSLASCATAGSITSLPTFLIQKPRELARPSSTDGGIAADVALCHYRSQGFSGDRTQARLSLQGYPGLLRDLSGPPSWVEVQPEDVEGYISPERAQELRPLVQLAQEHSEEFLVSRYLTERGRHASVLDRIVGQAASAAVHELSVDCFRRRVALAKSLGVEVFSAIYDAVFSFDEFTVAEGAPDLLLWLPGEPSFWFFSEVKASGDSLRPSQNGWLHQHWELVRGHYSITALE